MPQHSPSPTAQKKTPGIEPGASCFLFLFSAQAEVFPEEKASTQKFIINSLPQDRQCDRSPDQEEDWGRRR